MDSCKKAVLAALADTTGPWTGERDNSSGSIYFHACRVSWLQHFDRRKPLKWSGPLPYTGHWSRWCDRVDAVLAELVASGTVDVYETPTCWVWGTLIRGYTDGYWLASRPAPKDVRHPWAPLQRVGTATSQCVFAEALAAIALADEIHIHVDPTVFDVAGVYVRVTKRVVRELLEKRASAGAQVCLTITHEGAKVWIEPAPSPCA